MKLYILSDLHNEFYQYFSSDASLEADVVVLAGDIQGWINGIEWARAEWPDKPIVYVAGNHEFYAYDRVQTIAEMREAAVQQNVHFLENNAVVIDGVRFLGCTLWTDFEYFGKDSKEYYMLYGDNHLNDFSMIQNGSKTFTPTDSTVVHAESLAWLKAELSKDFYGYTVVVTHHAPSEMSVSDRWKTAPLTACFASGLEQFIADNPIKLWIHGHTHDSFDYKLSNTRVVCNPRGYTRNPYTQENLQFNKKLIIDI